MNDTTPPISDIWRRGAWLGLQWLALFAVITAVLYAGMGLLGWAGITRALVAMLVGPLVGSVMIALWWLARRPVLSPAPDPDTPGE